MRAPGQSSGPLCQAEMGAMISEEEFRDIILASLPPSYEAVMNALTTSLQECNRPLEPDNIIRVLKAQ